MNTHYIVVGLAALALLGCAQVKNPLARTLPDETQVLSGPNLSLPPSFELRPPREGEANEALLRSPAVAATHVSRTTGADAWLVNQAQQQAGVIADEGVRADLELATVSETQVKSEEKAKMGLIQRWKNWNSGE